MVTDHLLNHLQNPKFRDKRSPLIDTIKGNRLRPGYFVGRGDIQTAAGFIAGLHSWPVTWFPDANVAFRSDTQVLWDALRLAALGQRQDKVVIAGTVEYEMQEWLADPWQHKERAGAIKTALEQKTWLKKFGMATSHPLYPAVLGYTYLLGRRRLLARPCPDGKTLVDTDPAAKCETMNAIRNQIGPRAERLAKKGRIDSEKTGLININDEYTCLLAISYALLTGNDAVILTTDEDFVEIFWKAQWFFDTHYRAWLAAKMVKDGKYGEPVRELTDTHGYFDSPLTLYRRPTSHLAEVLPPIHTPVRAGVVYIRPDNNIATAFFSFEREMTGLLETRAKTNGCCTDLFGESNIHVHLGPLTHLLDGTHFGIGKDAGDYHGPDGKKCNPPNGQDDNILRTFLSRLDEAHSMVTEERFA